MERTTITTYQLIYLRYLRMCADFPELNHRGHAPVGVEDFTDYFCPCGEYKDEQRAAAEREFYRPIEQPLTGEGAPALETQSVSVLLPPSATL